MVAAVADEVEASAVYVTADFGPYGAARDEAVAAALADHGRPLVRVGSPYVVDPGTIVKNNGEPFSVFTPYYRAWTYIRRWVPELASLTPPQVLEPWKLADGPPVGYPRPIVDHGAERAHALARYAEVRRA